MTWRRVVTAALLICSACAPEVPKQLESGFSMAEHSLAFSNFALGYEQSAMDEALLQRMFGDKVCQGGSTSPCRLTPGARAFMKKANTSMNGGRCEGFAVMASLFESKKLNPVDFGGVTARDLTLDDNEPLQREIAYWFSTQLVSDVSASKTKAYQAKDVMPALAKALAKDAPERFRIGIVRKKGKTVSGGHALTPISYAADASEKGVYWLRVYDNNNPDAERLLKIDTANNRWEFNAAENPKQATRLYYGDSENKNPLYLAPILNRTGQLPCDFCEGGGKTLVTTGGGLQAWLAGLGVRDGEVSEGTSPNFSLGLDDAPAEFNFFLPAGEANLELTNPGDADFPEAEQEVDLQGENFAVSAFNLHVTGLDQLRVGAGGTSVAFDNASGNPLGLKTEVGLPDGRSLSVAAVVSGTSTGVTASVDPSSGKVDIGAAGSAGSQVTLVVTTTDTMGEERSGQLTFVSSGDGGISAETMGWMSGAPLSGTVNNNGTTMMVSNACEDGVKSGMESDVDCGAVCTLKCSVGQGCGAGADCQSTFCHATTRTCVATSCVDGARTADETDVDCGGSCGACAVGRSCMNNTDCAGTASCQLGTCRATYAVGVTVSGLPAGSAPIVLQNNGADDLTIAGDGSFAFSTRVTGAYAVTLLTQSNLGVCTVASGSGTATADVVVAVTCTPTFSIGGAVSGLPMGQSVVLRNGGETSTVSADGAFTFSTRVAGAYAVTVDTQPTGATCTVSAGSGTATADVTTVAVTCTTGFSIGGTVSGLPGGQSVVLQNGAESLTATMNGSFTFTTRVQGAYAVSVTTQPMGATCTVSAGSGTATADVTSVSVTCVSGFLIGGAVVGLPMFESVTLQNNGADDLVVSIDGPFTFTTRTTSYAVTVLTQPAGARCSVASGSGTASANVTSVMVTCAPSGVLDPSFNMTGWRATASPGTSDFWLDGLVEFDNSVVLVGQVQVSGSDNDWNITKLRADGTVDPSFGSFGQTVVSGGAALESARGIFTDAMGGYIILGTLAGASDPDPGIARLTPTGLLDPLFGTFGITTHDTGQWEYIEDAAADSQGRYYVVGRRSASGAGPHDAIIGRFTSSGALDMGFGTNGWIVYDSGGDDSGNSITIDATGDVIAAVAVGGDTRLLRFDDTGAPRATFGTAGVVTVDLSGASQTDWPYRVITSGTRVLVVGRVDAANQNLVVMQFTNTGAADTSFGTGGRLLIDRGGDEVGYAITPAPGGGWYLGGHSSSLLLVTKISAAGVVDTTFGTMGFFTDAIVNSALAYHLMVDSAQRIVAVGTIRFTGSEDLGVARLTP